MTVNNSKSILYFDPNKLPKHYHVVVIGLGAVGSLVSESLVRLGVPLSKLILVDFDTVEDHNLCNQFAYTQKDVGHLKAYALNSRLHDIVGSTFVDSPDNQETPLLITKRVSAIPCHKHSPAFVFTCVDTMASRYELWESAKRESSVQFYGDTRMSSTGGVVYALYPQDPEYQRQYEETLYPDEDVPQDERAVCSVVPAVGPTAMMTASHMVWMFVDHAMAENQKFAVHEVIFQTHPRLVMARRFD